MEHKNNIFSEVNKEREQKEKEMIDHLEEEDRVRVAWHIFSKMYILFFFFLFTFIMLIIIIWPILTIYYVGKAEEITKVVPNCLPTPSDCQERFFETFNFSWVIYKWVKMTQSIDYFCN